MDTKSPSLYIINIKLVDPIARSVYPAAIIINDGIITKIIRQDTDLRTIGAWLSDKADCPKTPNAEHSSEIITTCADCVSPSAYISLRVYGFSDSPRYKSRADCLPMSNCCNKTQL